MGGEVAADVAGRGWVRRTSRALVVTLAVGSVAALAVSPFASGDVWSSLTPGDCAEYCEHSFRCGLPATRSVVQQPLNAWSSLAYLFVGLLTLGSTTRRSATTWLFATSCAVLAVGSFGFHATVTRELQWLDMVGAYGVLVAVAARGFTRAFAVDERRAVVAALAVDALIAVCKWRLDSGVVLPLLVVVAGVPFVRLVRAGLRSIVAGAWPLLLGGAAVALRTLDVSRALCWPDSAVFQGHALWHVLTAAALGVGFALFDDAPVDDDRARRDASG